MSLLWYWRCRMANSRVELECKREARRKEKEEAISYLNERGAQKQLELLLNEAVRTKPEDFFGYLVCGSNSAYFLFHANRLFLDERDEPSILTCNHLSGNNREFWIESYMSTWCWAISRYTYSVVSLTCLCTTTTTTA